MRRDDLTNLAVFLAVAEERSFTRAAARLGLTQSTLSHTVRGFEERLGVRLLMRTTRNVAPTDAGERLLAAASPRLAEIEMELEALSASRGKLAGSVRLSTSAHAYETALWPALKRLLPAHPDIRVETVIEHRFTNIVAERFDAGVRIGEAVERDMIAVRIGPDLRFIVVGAPSYLAGRSPPVGPQDLTAHRCINFRNGTTGGMYAWEFERAGRSLEVRVDGQLAFDDSLRALEAAIAGFGFAYVPEDAALALLRRGQLVQVLDDWCRPFPGYHLYYPSRRQMTPVFALLVETLRFRDPVFGKTPRRSR